ncbi:extensin-like [Aplysia californica]|uniref:Extensin-like n=1 Tax=Aplysia californica TaxID=6500 RepID=A0ABM1W1L5_APLCA|nr:extensin-like [Aplysia californica]
MSISGIVKWYFSSMQRAMSPRMPIKDPGDYPALAAASTPPLQRLNRDGFYGDRLPGKGRKKRSSDDNSDSSSSNDVVTFGDVTVPLDFFKPPERSESSALPTYFPPRPPVYSTYFNRPFAPSLPRRSLYSSPASPLPSWQRSSFGRPTPRFSYASPRFGSSPPLRTSGGYYHGRKKRAAEGGGNNDVITVGDVSIPVDFFKPPEKSDDRKRFPPRQPAQSPAQYYPSSSRVKKNPAQLKQRLAELSQMYAPTQHRSAPSPPQQYYNQEQNLVQQPYYPAPYTPQTNQLPAATKPLPQTPPAGRPPPPQQNFAPPTQQNYAPSQNSVFLPPPPPPPQNPPPSQNQAPPYTTHQAPPPAGPASAPLNMAPPMSNYGPPPPHGSLLPANLDPFIRPPIQPTIHPATHPAPLGRKKRASGDDNSDSSSSNNDVITFGDFSVPVDFFKPSENAPPARAPPPPVYIQYVPYPSLRQTPPRPAYFPQRFPPAANPYGYFPPQPRYPPPRSPYTPYAPPPAFVPPYAAQAHRRYKRSDNKDKGDNSASSFFPTSFFSPLFSPFQTSPLFTPPRVASPFFGPSPFFRPPRVASPYFPPNPFPSTPNKIAYRNPRGQGVIYGDRMPWAQSPAAGGQPRRRVKRSDNNDNPESNTSPNFFSSPFFSPFFPSYRPSPYFSPSFFSSPMTNKIAYKNTGGQGLIYGDRMPWAQKPGPQPLMQTSPVLNQSPPMRQSANSAQTLTSGVTSPGSQPLTSPAAHQPHRRFKRSDNKDNKDSSYTFPSFFPSPFFSPFTPPSPPLNPSRFFFRQYPPPSNKIGYRGGRGQGVIYGDRLPWAPRSPPLTSGRGPLYALRRTG